MLTSMVTSIPTSKWLWGGDCYYVEESDGALRQAQRVVTAALADLVIDGELAESEAIDLAVGLFCLNGLQIYGLA